jgi:hypothetical protein
MLQLIVGYRVARVLTNVGSALPCGAIWQFFYCEFSDCDRKIGTANSSLVMSVRPSAWNNSATTGGIFMKFDI